MKLHVDIEKSFQGFNMKVRFSADENTLGLLGASGSGKSMTLRCIAGLEKPDRGRIVLNNRILFDSDKGINLPCQKRKVGFLFQNYALFPNMTVEENIGFALSGLSKGEVKKRVSEKIHMIKLEGLENRYPHQLSGGQQQRVALARALAIEPEVILLDEPFSALDNHLRSQLESQLVKTLKEYSGISIFVSHNMNEAYRVCDKLVILSKGEVTAEGEKKEIFVSPPNTTTAILTGCKNISRVKNITEGKLEAVDWGCTLQLKEEKSNEIKYVGIRNKHIHVGENFEEENIFKGWVVDTLESINTTTLYISFKEPSENSSEYNLQWEITKEKWDRIKRNSNELDGYIVLPVKIDSKKLILMNK